MLTRLKVCAAFLFLISSGYIGQASAEGYWAVKGGLASVNNNGYDDVVNVGLMLGADLSGNGLAIEGEITKTLIDGNTNTPGVDWDVDTIAFFIAMRSASDSYLKLKVGYLDREINLSTGNSRSQSGLAWGVGAGFSIAGGNRLEIEFTTGDEDGASDLDMITVAWMF